MNYVTDTYQDLEDRYASTENYIKQLCSGTIGSLIVNGPPGLGKTHSVETYLGKYARSRFTVFAGHMSILSLYGTLYHYRSRGDVVVLDDIDSVLTEVHGINILKAAMDTKQRRHISWESTTHLLKAMGVPTSFDYEGSVIMISNIRDRSEKKVAAHLQALKDRAFSITVADSSKESQFRQVCFMVLKRGLLSRFSLGAEQELEVLSYLHTNLNKLERISLRTAVKLAQLIQIDPDGWRIMAGSGVLENLD
jgi:hypothetical protein